ncbi:MAG: preprotein translocase subunit YajC [Pseudohongiellaceae bacterium]
MDFLIPTAYAQAPQAAAPSTTFNLIFIGGMFLLFYLILWRPQSKRAKEHRELISAISKGDEVMTSGGIIGRVTRVSDDYIAVEISKGVEIRLQKSSVSAALPKGTIDNI